MQTLFWTCALLFLQCYCSAEDCVYISSDDEISEQYTTAKELCLRVDAGFEILFNVKTIKTDPGNLDYFIIKQGKKLEDDGAGIIFSHKLDNPRTFTIYSNFAFIKLELSPTSTSGQATFSYKRIGEKTIATTPNPLPQTTWPQPAPDDSVYFTAFVSGYDYSRYKEVSVRLKFRNSVAKMAAEYSKTNNFPTIKEITADNVIINVLKMCPLDLPESSSCAMITYALPILMDETQYSGYEFKEEHLTLMWTRYGEKYLSENGFHIYQVPDAESASTAWGVVIAIILLVLLALMAIAIYIHEKIMHFIKINRRTSDAMIIIEPAQRESTTSLSLHQLQVFPPIFDQDVPSPGIYQDDFEPVWNRDKKRINLNTTQYDNGAFESES